MAVNVRTVRLRRLQGQLGEVAYKLTKVHFSSFQSAESTWQPAVNAYRCATCLRVCVDLAGVDKSAIELRIEPGQLILRGRRELPHPEGDDVASPPHRRGLQVLAMEIDHGPFERRFDLPSDVVASRVTAEQHNGLLWILLPLRSHA